MSTVNLLRYSVYKSFKNYGFPLQFLWRGQGELYLWMKLPELDENVIIHRIRISIFVQFIKYIFIDFAWADQRAKVYFIFHKGLLRCKECFIE